MPILHLSDRETIEGSLALPLDPELLDLLAARVSHLAAGGLLDMTEIVVADHDAAGPELIAALGFDPLLDLDGRRYGEPGFCPAIDYVARVSPRYHEAIVAVGNSGLPPLFNVSKMTCASSSAARVMTISRKCSNRTVDIASNRLETIAAVPGSA